jgi:hypothetical protein
MVRTSRALGPASPPQACAAQERVGAVCAPHAASSASSGIAYGRVASSVRDRQAGWGCVRVGHACVSLGPTQRAQRPGGTMDDIRALTGKGGCAWVQSEVEATLQRINSHKVRCRGAARAQPPHGSP